MTLSDTQPVSHSALVRLADDPLGMCWDRVVNGHVLDVTFLVDSNTTNV